MHPRAAAALLVEGSRSTRGSSADRCGGGQGSDEVVWRMVRRRIGDATWRIVRGRFGEALWSRAPRLKMNVACTSFLFFPLLFFLAMTDGAIFFRVEEDVPIYLPTYQPSPLDN
jgi:hypothetical protein